MAPLSADDLAARIVLSFAVQRDVCGPNLMAFTCEWVVCLCVCVFVCAIRQLDRVACRETHSVVDGVSARLLPADMGVGSRFKKLGCGLVGAKERFQRAI